MTAVTQARTHAEPRATGSEKPRSRSTLAQVSVLQAPQKRTSQKSPREAASSSDAQIQFQMIAMIEKAHGTDRWADFFWG